jgi:hypothetical protein
MIRGNLLISVRECVALLEDPDSETPNQKFLEKYIILFLQIDLMRPPADWICAWDDMK